MGQELLRIGANKITLVCRVHDAPEAPERTDYFGTFIARPRKAKLQLVCCNADSRVLLLSWCQRSQQVQPGFRTLRRGAQADDDKRQAAWAKRSLRLERCDGGHLCMLGNPRVPNALTELPPHPGGSWVRTSETATAHWREVFAPADDPSEERGLLLPGDATPPHLHRPRWRLSPLCASGAARARRRSGHSRNGDGGCGSSAALMGRGATPCCRRPGRRGHQWRPCQPRDGVCQRLLCSGLAVVGGIVQNLV